MASNRIYLQVDLSSDQAQANVNALNKAVAGLGPSSDKTSQQATGAFQRIGVSVEQTSNAFGQLSSAIAGLGLTRLLTNWVSLGSEIGRVQQAMRAFTGSADEAANVFEQIRAIAAQSPFRFKELEETGRLLLGFGVAAKEVPGTLKAITDQVTAMGGSIDSVNAIVRIFGRVMEKDFVGAMDLMRTLPQQGVPIMQALRQEMEKSLGRPVDTAQIKQAIKDGILDPLQTLRTITEAMARSGGIGRVTGDASIAFKNLADSIQFAVARFFGPEGFGPAIANLAKEIQNLLAPLAGLLEHLRTLPEPTKELIVNIAAGTAAVVALYGAFKLFTGLVGPLLDVVGAIGKLGAALLALDPEILIITALVGTLTYGLYASIPEIKNSVDKWVGGILDTLKTKLGGLAQEGQKFMADAMKKISTATAPGNIIGGQELFDKLQQNIQKTADMAERTLLQAFTSPVEAVRMKYAPLFAELEDKMKSLPADMQNALRASLTGAMSTEISAAFVQQRKRDLDELERYQKEKIKGAADAEIAYIEATDARDLQTRVANIDKITQLRIGSAEQIATIERNRLQADLQYFLEMVNQYRTQFEKAGIDVDQMIAQRQEETRIKQLTVDQKAFDETQKYRLEGWKKANDAIIEDQKRIYESFRDIFDQFFEAFTDKSKSLGQAIGDLFKKLAIGELKETFSNQMAAMATEAAGYGRPEEAMAQRGRGLLGILLRRGMPPRPPLPPPQVQELPEATSAFRPLLAAADLNTASAQVQVNAAQRFSDAVAQFQTAITEMPSGGGGEYVEPMRRPGVVPATQELLRFAQQSRVMPAPPSIETLINQATAKYGLPPNLLRAVAQVESGFNPRAVSSAGALGMLQLMPGTAADLGVTQPFSSQQSIDAGARYLSQLLTRYQGDIPRALAAYNAGMGRVSRAGNVPSYTLGYIAQVQGLMQQMQGQAPPSGLGAAAAQPPTLAQLAALPLARPYQQLLLPQMPTTFEAALPAAVTTAMPTVTPAETQARTSWLSQLSQFSRMLGLGGAGAAAAAAEVPVSAADIARYGLGQTPGAESLARAAAAAGPGSPLRQLASLIGIGTGVAGATTLRSVLTSRGVGMLASLGGMALLTRGLQQRVAPAATIGGGLAGVGAVLSSPQLMTRLAAGPGGLGAGLGAGAAAGAGLGLFAAGFQRGGGAGLGMDIGGGALAGAGIGFMVGGPIGAAIGAAVGAVAGGITGLVRLFVHTKQEQIRQQLKQVYGLDISNRQILTQIQQIIDQQFGGSISVGIRSQNVQDIVRLYALSTGQAAQLPRPMYAATIAQSQGGLAMQPVYQGGVLVQNPYTGPTTYQYQTAVTQAQGLLAGTSQGVPGATGQVGNIFLQLNPQQATDLFTGRVVQAVQQNPSAVANANAAASRAGDSRVTQAANMLEPLTALS